MRDSGIFFGESRISVSQSRFSVCKSRTRTVRGVRASASRVFPSVTVVRASATGVRPDVTCDSGCGIGRDLAASALRLSAGGVRLSARGLRSSVIRVPPFTSVARTFVRAVCTSATAVRPDVIGEWGFVICGNVIRHRDESVQIPNPQSQIPSARLPVPAAHHWAAVVVVFIEAMTLPIASSSARSFRIHRKTATTSFCQST